VAREQAALDYRDHQTPSDLENRRPAVAGRLLMGAGRDVAEDLAGNGARRDRAGAAAFQTVDLPRAGTLLAQGAGRLIRTAGDRGVVAVLDSRLASATYRGVLLARVPPMRRVVERRVVEEFLHQQVVQTG